MLRIEDCVSGTPIECINNAQLTRTLTLKAIYTIKCPFVCPCDGEFRIHLDGKLGCFDRHRFRLLPPGRLDVFKEALNTTDIPPDVVKPRIPEEV